MQRFRFNKHSWNAKEPVLLSHGEAESLHRAASGFQGLMLFACSTFESSRQYSERLQNHGAKPGSLRASEGQVLCQNLESHHESGLWPLRIRKACRKGITSILAMASRRESGEIRAEKYQQWAQGRKVEYFSLKAHPRSTIYLQRFRTQSKPLDCPANPCSPNTGLGCCEESLLLSP